MFLAKVYMLAVIRDPAWVLIYVLALMATKVTIVSLLFAAICSQRRGTTLMVQSRGASMEAFAQGEIFAIVFRPHRYPGECILALIEVIQGGLARIAPFLFEHRVFSILIARI